MTDAPPRAIVVPDITPEDDALGAALKYAEAGLYVVPVKRGSKHPGSVLGQGWQHQSTRDPRTIAMWWAGTDHGVALHTGRSGVLAVDVDDPASMPPALIAAVLDLDHQPPHQSTRTDVVGRGHYFFAMPPGRMLGNSTGGLAGGWGEMRGANGIVVVAPSVHEKGADGGRYAWTRTGPVPPLPEAVAALLPDASPAEDAATDKDVEAFLAAHDSGDDFELLDALVYTFRSSVEKGESRHAAMISRAAGAMKEARAGFYPADAAAGALESEFVDAVTRAGIGARQGAARDLRQAQAEWRGILAWAVGQALAADLDEIRARVEGHRPVAPPQLITQRKEQPWDSATSTPSSPTSSNDSSPPVSTSTTSTTPAATASPPDTTTAAPGAEPSAANSLGPASPSDPHESTRKLFPRVDWHKLWEAPDEDDWILEPLIPAGRLVALYSAPKVGKSLLMLELAVAVSMGRRFGLSEPERRHRVLYVDFENDPRGDVRQRLRAMGYGPDDLDHLDYLSFPTMAALDSERGGLELFAAAEAYGAEVVVVDTISRAVQGEENDNDTWLNLYRRTGMRLKAANIAMIRLDHSGKDADKGMRGGSAKVGDVDMIWRLTTVTDGKRYRLECTDSRMLVEHRDLQLIRHPYPLRHTVDILGVDDGRESKLAQAIAICDAAQLPDDAGRPRVREALARAGFKLRNDLATEVAKRRNVRTNAVPEGVENSVFDGTCLTSGNAKTVPSNTTCPDPAGTGWDNNGVSAGQACTDKAGTARDSTPPGTGCPPSPPVPGQGGGQSPNPDAADSEPEWFWGNVAGERRRISKATGAVLTGDE